MTSDFVSNSSVDTDILDKMAYWKEPYLKSFFTVLTHHKSPIAMHFRLPLLVQQTFQAVFQLSNKCASAADAMISIGDSSSLAESALWSLHPLCCILIQSISGTARAVKFCAFLPGFFGVRVKEPFTVRQWELSPPQTPHLSSTLVEPISLSQPTFWRQQQQQQKEVGLTLMQP